MQGAESENDSDDSEYDEENNEHNLPVRMTPMEVDVQLQITELVFRAVLEGQRVPVHPSEDITDWQKETCGQAWYQMNVRMKKQVLKKMKKSGEGSPMWMEALAAVSDISWEGLVQSQQGGERLRKTEEVKRSAIVKLFQELYPKLRDSYFARCGFGERTFGPRAALAIMYQFRHDAEVLQLVTECLRIIIHDVADNREGLVEVTVPLPPDERDDSTHKDRGWSFLRIALDALNVQEGGDPFGGVDAERPSEEPGQQGEARVVNCTRAAGLLLARCILSAKNTLAVQVQLRLLREPVPENACRPWQEMKVIVPVVIRKLEELVAEEPIQEYSELLTLLRLAVPEEGDPAEGFASLSDVGASSGMASSGVMVDSTTTIQTTVVD